MAAPDFTRSFLSARATSSSSYFNESLMETINSRYGSSLATPKSTYDGPSREVLVFSPIPPKRTHMVNVSALRVTPTNRVARDQAFLST